MKDRSTIWFLSVAFILPATAFAFFMWYEKKLSSLPVLGEKGHRVEQFTLRTQDDVNYEFGSSQKITVACFFFTHCPSVCPAMIKNMNRVQNRMKGEKDLQLLSITVDPEHDSADVLKKYCLSRGLDNSNWQFLTGGKKCIYLLARKSFRVVATDGDGGPADFIHSDKLVLIDQQRRIRGFYDGTSSRETDQLIADIKKLKDEN